MGLPRRRTTGVDFNRLSMLLAVLERRVGLRALAQHDVFVSSLGGVRLLEPAADLGIAIAIASSLKERPAHRKDLAIGEVGLTGEVRPATNLLQRIHEAKRVGFQRCFVAAGRGGIGEAEGIEVLPIRHLREAVALALEGPD
jgi:DNA repair protein RadA/Sms